ncbi:Hypothetical predicted protein [Octopus vulgaris]|uniref:Uncharacterized protein n=1 Tax=Octopus vulgaris TaxID=6645 RepID=A0AA36BEM3_OCTVU|nr:Hypothetical predicted protein [Octopus vulgaris]
MLPTLLDGHVLFRSAIERAVQRKHYIKQDEAEQTCLILTEKEQKEALQCPFSHQEETHDISIIKGT